MKKISIVFVVLFVCIFLVLPAPAPAFSQNADGLGSIQELDGAISHKSENSGEYVKLEGGAWSSLVLKNLDMLMTHEKTTAEISTNYGAAFRMHSNSEMQLLSNAIRLKRGAAWVNYKPVKSGKTGEIQFRVITPAGTIGIKGTQFIVNVSEDGKSVFVQVDEGVVNFESQNGSESVDINAGESLSAEAGKALPKPVKSGGPNEGATGGETGQIIPAPQSSSSEVIIKTIKANEGDNTLMDAIRK